MGNEKSVPAGLKMEEIIKITDDWVQKSATLSNDATRICVFEQHLRDENVQTLQKLSKNLMLYRHPNILKYISSWRTNKTLFVATEYGKPLALVIQDFMPMQLCIGLFSILNAVMFLQDMALSSHNNISKDAIYVTSEGCWKLGRLELLTRNQVNQKDSGETNSKITANNCESADHRGFANLANEILEKKTDDEIPAVTEFREFCKIHASATTFNPQFFHEVFTHPFFNHQFVRIYKFFTELPAKSEAEKTEFFKTLADELATFDEELVARQLGTLLLSRLVLLNSTAQDFLLPRLFTPKDDNESSLFTKPVFKNYILPRLLSMFSLRDSQIRLILLKHFASFGSVFSREQLQNVILPELLVGIKDTNEILVAATLHTLADLVPLLGASVVIGKGRAKLFADGRPLLMKETNNIPEKYTESELPSTIEMPVLNSFSLAERPSPDGGEDCTESNVITNEKDPAAVGDMKKQLDDTKVKNNKLILTKSRPEVVEIVVDPMEIFPLDFKEPAREALQPTILKMNDDLSSLDIKCSRSKADAAKFDDIELMFKDMEPVISRTAIVKIPSDVDLSNRCKFTAADIDCENLGGWGDDIVDWGNLEDDE